MKNIKYLIHAAVIVVVAILFLLSCKNLISFITFAILIAITSITHSLLIYKFENYETAFEKKLSKYTFIYEITCTVIIVTAGTLTFLNFATPSGLVLILILIFISQYTFRRRLEKSRKNNTDKTVNEESI